MNLIRIEELFLEHDASKYNFINQGMIKIDNVDDEQEMKDTKRAFDILLFTEVIIKSQGKFKVLKLKVQK